MSVLIKDMEMPKSCWNCCVERDADCAVYKGVASAKQYKENRYPDCPLIEIPKHGRLIDADALIKRIPTNFISIYCVERILGKINTAPTIITAEESE